MKLCERCDRVVATDTAYISGRAVKAAYEPNKAEAVAKVTGKSFQLCEPCASFVLSALEGRHVWARGDDSARASDLTPAHETALAAVIVTLGRIANEVPVPSRNRATYTALRDTAEQIRNWVIGEVNAHELAAMTEATRRNLDSRPDNRGSGGLDVESIREHNRKQRR